MKMNWKPMLLFFAGLFDPQTRVYAEAVPAASWIGSRFSSRESLGAKPPIHPRLQWHSMSGKDAFPGNSLCGTTASPAAG
jgi:hypothetical protein